MAIHFGLVMRLRVPRASGYIIFSGRESAFSELPRTGFLRYQSYFCHGPGNMFNQQREINQSKM